MSKVLKSDNKFWKDMEKHERSCIFGRHVSSVYALKFSQF